MSGTFIAIYGINNIGKSTQTNILVQRLIRAGVRVEYVKYPIYDLDPTGKMLNEILRGKKKSSVQQMIDFFPGTKVKKPTTRRSAHDAASTIFRLKPIDAGSVVKQKVTEEELQMWYSLNRYQYDPTLRRKLDEGLTVVAEDYTGTGLAWGSAKHADLGWLESVNKYLATPDLEILMDGERFLAGKEASHIHESNDRLITKARKEFQTLAKKYGWRVVNANQPIQAVADEIWAAVEPFIAKRRDERRSEFIVTPPHLEGGSNQLGLLSM